MQPVVLYTTTSCIYCRSAKAWLSAHGVPYTEVDVTDDDAARAALVERSGGQRTVPQIFVGDTHVGGYSDLVALDAAGKIHSPPRGSSPVRCPGAALSALALLALGCGSVPVTTHAEVDPGLKVAAVVLEPVRGVGVGDTSALGQRLLALTLDAVSGEALVWAGAEIQVLHPERRDWSANAAVPLLRAADVRPEQTVVVQARVVSGEASSQQEVQGAAGSAVGAAAELHFRATVEILQPSTGRVLVETSAQSHTDAFSSGASDAATTQPAAVLERAATEALGRLRGSVGASPHAQRPRPAHLDGGARSGGAALPRAGRRGAATGPPPNCKPRPLRGRGRPPGAASPGRACPRVPAGLSTPGRGLGAFH